MHPYYTCLRMCAYSRSLWKVSQKVICFLWFHLYAAHKCILSHTYTQFTREPSCLLFTLRVFCVCVCACACVCNKFIDCFYYSFVCAAQVLFSHILIAQRRVKTRRLSCARCCVQQARNNPWFQRVKRKIQVANSTSRSRFIPSLTLIASFVRALYIYKNSGTVFDD